MFSLKGIRIFRFPSYSNFRNNLIPLQPFSELRNDRPPVPDNHHTIQKQAFARQFLQPMTLRPAWSQSEKSTLSTALSRLYPAGIPQDIDWTTISTVASQLDRNFKRTYQSCEIEYIHHFSPSRSWTPQEEDHLSSLVAETNGTDWTFIASKLSRTPFECYSHCYSSLNPVIVPSDFSPEDDQNLIELISNHGDGSWALIALEMGTGHTETQLQNRWNKTLKPGIRSGRWTPNLDGRLKAAVAIYGTGKWALIAQHVPGKTDRKCRERYLEQLAPGLKPPGEWDDEEDEILIKAVQKHGIGNWAKIKNDLEGRTDQMCRLRYQKIMPEDEKEIFESKLNSQRELKLARGRRNIDNFVRAAVSLSSPRKRGRPKKGE